MSDSGERPVWSMDGSDLLSELDLLDAELARLQTRRLQVIARLDEIGHAQEVGAHNTAQLLAFRYRLDRPQAYRDVRLARALPKYQAITTQLNASNWIFRPAQAEAIITVFERLPTTVAVEDVAVAERELVELARRLSPNELRKAAVRASNILDTDGPEPEEHKAYRRESLVLSRVAHGVKFRGYLANENAELLYSLIHAGARPHKTVDGEPDPRPRDKRQADALTTVLTIAATTTDTSPTALTTPPSTTATTTPATPTTASDSAPTPAAPHSPAVPQDSTGDSCDRSGPRRPDWVPGFGAKANITVTIDLQDLKSATADATGELVYGDDLSAATIRRMACDARIIPLVLGSNSEPLDVGRGERLVTRGMRRALNARDKGCVVCSAPPIHCDAHHLESWITGGDTAVHNLVLLCRRHHIDLHAGHWNITITNNKVHVTRPTWAEPSAPRSQPLFRTHTVPSTAA